MGYVFISYSTKDQISADKLREMFKIKGIATWMAPDDIPVGSLYAQVINRAIKECECCVLLLTKDSQKSTWVSREIERAIHYGKPVFPVRLGEFKLNDEFEFYLSTCQIIALWNIESDPKQIQKLCDSLQAYMEPLSEEDWKMYDDMLFAVGKIIERQERKTAVLDPIRLKQMQFAYALIRDLTKDTDAQVSYRLHEPYKSTGSITVETESLEITNTELFARAAEFADNTEVYPLVNGKVRMSLTFHGLVRYCE